MGQKPGTYALGLNHAVNEGASNTREDLDGLSVRRRLAVITAVLLVGLRSLLKTF
jgi:hypothetical protein